MAACVCMYVGAWVCLCVCLFARACMSVCMSACVLHARVSDCVCVHADEWECLRVCIAFNNVNMSMFTRCLYLPLYCSIIRDATTTSR